MAVYFLAGPIASLVSFGLGGWLNDQYGWRWTFLLMGAPALLVALLVKTTVREPRAKRAANAVQLVAPRVGKVLAQRCGGAVPRAI